MSEKEKENGKGKPVSMGRIRGLEEPIRDVDLRTSITEAENTSFEFLSHFVGGETRAKWNPKGKSPKDIPSIKTLDLQLSSADWARWIIGRFSPWIDLDAEDEKLREVSRVAFDRELEYMRYLGLSAILLDLKRADNPNMARELGERLWTKNGFVSQIWVVVKLAGDAGDEDTWLWWYRFRQQLGDHRRISVCLKMDVDLPGEGVRRQRIIDRWLGEPISAVWLDTRLFLSTESGVPVLPKSHKKSLLSLFRLNCQPLLSGGQSSDGTLKEYVKYVNQLWLTRPPIDSIAAWSRGYEDHLQVPLQPLADNLESSTYEVFEKDPVKYKLYQAAMEKALREVSSRGDGKIVLMVLGAGRGPLVTAALAAIKEVALEGKTQVFAVEKNYNSVVTLQYLRDNVWEQKVEVIASDMREAKPDQKADIVVSELLGSFGDNELSPECLYGAAELMKPNCISIPAKYTSFLAPVQSPRVYESIRDDLSGASIVVTGKGMRNGSRPPVVTELLTSDGVSDVFDLPYIVRLQNHYQIADPKPVFEFTHPSNEKKSNERRTSLSFRAELSTELMGFAGYFHCTLYEGVEMGIVPGMHTEGMFSWFPALFPLARPVLVREGETIELEMWRMADAEKVWYEWLLRSPHQLRIQNSGGKAYSMSLV